MPETDFKPRVVFWLLIILVLLGFAAAVLYFGRNNQDLIKDGQAVVSHPPARQARTYTVFYDISIFSPTNIRIHAGDSVRFQNDSNKPIRVVSDSTNGIPDLAGFDSIGDIQSNGIFSYTFDRPGIFGYHNAKNANEAGTVIVRP